MQKKAQIIVGIYKEFFNKVPDFSQENKRNITIEIQSMSYILRTYGIDLGYRYVYNELEDLHMPVSMDLQDVILEQLLYHDTKDFEEKSQLKTDIKTKINSIGKIITSEINDKECPIEALRLISSVLYTAEYILPNSSASQEAEFNNCTYDEVERIKRLIPTSSLDNANDFSGAKKN